MKSLILLCYTAFYIWICCLPVVLGDISLRDSSSSLAESPSHMSDNHTSGENKIENDELFTNSKPNVRNKRSYGRLIELLRGDLGKKVLQAYRKNALINNRMTRGMMYPSDPFSRRFLGSRGKRTASETTKTEEKGGKGNQDGNISEKNQEQENNIAKVQGPEMFSDSYDLIDDRNRRSALDDIHMSERSDLNSKDRPGFAFFGSRGKKEGPLDLNDYFEYLEYNDEDVPFIHPEMTKKELSNTFWGIRGKRKMGDIETRGLDMFFGPKGNKDEVSESNGAYSLSGSDHQHEAVAEEKQKRPSPSQEFWGIRGKKADSYINPLGRNFDSGNSFWGARGKRYSPGQEFWGIRGKKYNPGQDFWGIRGKKYNPGEGFWGVRGKKQDSGEQFWGVRGKKPNPGQGFWGARGKKYGAGQDFWGARGRRGDLSNAFWGVRGKKFSNFELQPYSGLETSQEFPEASKRDDLGQTFWGVRGKKSSIIPSETFWGARGKKDGVIPQDMFWGTRGKRNYFINSEGQSISPNNLIRYNRDMKPFTRLYPRLRFWEIKGKKIDPSRMFFGIRGKR